MHAMISPEQFLRRATEETRAWLSETSPLPNAVIPVNDRGWEESLHESSVIGVPRALEESWNVVQIAVAQADFQAARAASLSLVSSFKPVLDDLWCLAALRPAATCGIPTLYWALRKALENLVDRLEGSQPDEFESLLIKVRVAVDAVDQDRNLDGDDPWKTALGIDSESVTDTRGVVVSARLLAAYLGRYDELQRIAQTVFSPISSSPLPLVKLGTGFHAVMDSPFPLRTLRTAIAVKELILASFQAYPERTAQTVHALTERLDASYSSHVGIVRTISNLASCESASEKAFLRLDLYRRMVEGQLRPWGWVVLRLLGRGPDNLPELGPLNQQLVACSSRLATDIAGSILPLVRNAAAHEDYSWDGIAGVLKVGSSTVTVESLIWATETSYSLMCGAEIGWMFARAESREFDQFLGKLESRTNPTALGHIAARDYFGANGLQINRWIEDEGVLSIQLDKLNKDQVNPCLQATMWAAQHLPMIQRFGVSESGRPESALDLDRSVLDALFPLWMPAKRWFSKMPVSVFIPALSVARLAKSNAAQAAAAAVWLAYDEAVYAFVGLRDSNASNKDRLILLGHSLLLAAEALRTSASLMPNASEYLLGPPYRRLRSAARWALSDMALAEPREYSYFQGQILALYEKMAVPEDVPGFSFPG